MPIQRLPEHLLWGTLLDLFVRDYSGLEILLGLRVVEGGNGVGLSGSSQLPIVTHSHVIALPAVQVTRVFRPVDAQQAQREAQRDADHHRADRAQDGIERGEAHLVLFGSERATAPASLRNGSKRASGTGKQANYIQPECGASVRLFNLRETCNFLP